MDKKTAFTRFKAPNITGNTLLLTHTDLDGSGPAILLRTVFPNLTIQHCSNNTMSFDIKNAVCNPNVSSQYSTIIATDISCNEEDALKINANPNNKKLILLDHHQTALHLNKYRWARVSVESLEDSYRMQYYPKDTTALTSGTSLLYDFMEHFKMLNKCHLAHTKELVHLIASYDTWDWHNVFNDKKECQKLDKLFDIYGYARMEDKLYKFITTDAPLFTETDELLLDIEKDKVANYLTSIDKCLKTGNLKMNDRYYSIVFCNSNNYPTETFEHMKELYPDHDLYLINYGTGLSLRTTKNDINVGLLVKELGGGGHAGAGGVKIKPELLNNIISETMQAELFIDEPETNDRKTNTPLPRKNITKQREDAKNVINTNNKTIEKNLGD